MTASQLLALSLGLSVAAAALGLIIMRALERRVADPVLRERAWAAALYIAALPPLAVGLMLLLPAPVRTIAPTVPVASLTTIVVEFESASGSQLLDHAQTAAVAVLILAGLFALLRTAWLGLRLLRLGRLVSDAVGAPEDLRRTVERTAHNLGVIAPAVRVNKAGGEALLTGLLRPVLVLPAGFAAAPLATTTHAVCAHELAHLKRGDHRALWIEEILLAVAAVNPLLRVIRDHRAAAREEACDAIALAGSTDAQRRLYARSLLEAVQAAGFQRTAPALTFTSARRTFVMNRLKAVLTPASPASARSRRVTVGLAALIAGVVGAGSFAVAAQRQPVIAPADADAPAAYQPSLAPAASPRPEAVVAGPRQTDGAAPSPAPAPLPLSQPGPAGATGEPAASPTPVQTPPAEITRVTWAQHPMPMYPAAAAANGVDSGTAVLSCVVEADGSASGCTVLSESPEGQGFGDAALASMERAKFSPTLMETATVGVRARFTIRFRLGE